MNAPRSRETSAEPPLAKKRRAASLKGHRTRKRMAAARQKRLSEFLRGEFIVTAVRPFGDRLLWPSSYRPSDE